MPSPRFENALRGVPQSVPPVWLMRQAGRYHKHYRALKERHSFEELCRDPDLASEVTLGPILDFDFDTAILFSDLLFPLDALGFGLSYASGKPELANRLDRAFLPKIKPAGEALPELDFQRQAMLAARKKLPETKSLIGFVGGPWTLFTYAVEGLHAGSLARSKASLPLYREFLSTLVPLLIGNIRLQLEGGAEIAMVFDTAAGELSPALFREAVVPSLRELAMAFPGKLGYYSRGTQPAHFTDGFWKEGLLAGAGYDHRFDLPSLLETKGRGFVQGNFDQALLFCEPADLKRHLGEWLAPLRALAPEERASWVCGLGHGVLPGTPEENVRFFVNEVRRAFA